MTANVFIEATARVTNDVGPALLDLFRSVSHGAMVASQIAHKIMTDLGKLDWGDLIALGGVAGAYFTFRTVLMMIQQLRAADRATLVVSPSTDQVRLQVDQTHLRVAAEDGSVPVLRLKNAGPGHALQVELRAEVIVDQKLEKVVDDPSPRAFGPMGSPRFLRLGAPSGLAIGAEVGGQLDPAAETYVLDCAFAAHWDVVASDQGVEVAIPPAILRALTFYQAMAEEQDPNLSAPLRVTLRWRTRLGYEHEEVAVYALAGQRARRVDTALLYRFDLARTPARRVSETLRRLDFQHAERRRYARYFRRTEAAINTAQRRARDAGRKAA